MKSFVLDCLSFALPTGDTEKFTIKAVLFTLAMAMLSKYRLDCEFLCIAEGV